jgi:large subunit ribosomal protein L6
MSRVGKKPIPIPQGVNVKIEGQKISVKGSRGELNYQLPEKLNLKIESGFIMISREGDDRFQRALHGLARALISNLVIGVSKGFKKSLIIEGVGYRAQAKGDILTLVLGHSHPIEFAVPKGIAVSVEKNTVTLESNDKHLLGQTAAIIRDFRKVEPYKGKGIRYEGEFVRRKAGKVGT